MKKRILALLLSLSLVLTFLPLTSVQAYGGEWFNPDSTEGTVGWVSLGSAIDGDPNTYALTAMEVGGNAWSSPIYFPISETVIDSIKYVSGQSVAAVKIEVYWGGEWHLVLPSGSPGDYTVPLGGNYSVTNAKVYVFNAFFACRTLGFHLFQYHESTPIAVTSTVSNFNPDEGTVTLNANLASLGNSDTVYAYFQWGETTAYGTTTGEQEKDSVGVYHQDLDTLSSGTYHYRAVVRHDVTHYAYGEDKAFSFIEPTIVTNSASSIASTTATLNADLSSMGDYTTVYVWFQWGEGAYTEDEGEQTLYSSQTFDEGIVGLVAGTEYQFRANVKYGLTEYVYGDKKTFKSLSESPSNTDAAEGINEIILTWTKGTGAAETVIQRDTIGYPATYEDGCNVYQGDGTLYVDQDLSAGITYYYSLWSLTEAAYSEEHDTASAIPDALPSRCEYYNEDDDSAYHVWGTNWGSQVFTVDWQHNIESVRLSMYRDGNPGTLTTSLYLLDLNGRPTFPALTSGTINANYITELTCGDWYEIDFEGVEFEVGQQVAIVYSASTGDVANYVGIRYNSSGEYEEGLSLTSNNGGFSWTKTPDNDFMFETYSKFALELLSARVFSNYIEEGDWLFVFSYQNLFRPSATPEEYFDLQLLDGEAILSQIKLPAWGFRPGSIYICPASVVPLSWGEAYTIRMESRFVDPEGNRLITDYTLQSADWVGSSMTVLDSFVLTQALTIGDYYTYLIPVGVDGDGNIVYDEVVTRLTGYVGTLEKFTDEGAVMFLKGIPMLNVQRPDLFLTPAGGLDKGEETFTHAGDTRDWEAILGADTVNLCTAAGEVIGVEAKQTAQIGLFGLFLIISCIFASVGYGMIGLGVASPVLIIGSLTGIFSLAALAVGAVILVLVVVWIIWFRGVA